MADSKTSFIRHRELVDKFGNRHDAIEQEPSFQEISDLVDITTFDLHRYYKDDDSTDIFDVIEIKMNKIKKLSVKNGYCSSINKYSGFSLWSPHAIIFKTLQNHDATIKCKQVIRIPPTFVLVFDRCYVAKDLNNVKHEFRHYLISANGEYCVDELNESCSRIGTQPCIFQAASGTLEEFYDLFEDSHMEGYAMQHVLRQNANNREVSTSSRLTSAILSVWIGSNQLDESSLPMMYQNFPWAFHFIYRCFQMYPYHHEPLWRSDYYSQCITTMKHMMFPLSTIINMCNHISKWKNRCCLKYKREVPKEVYNKDLIGIIGTSSDFQLEQVQQGSMSYFFSFSDQGTMSTGFQLSGSEEWVSVGFSNLGQTLVLSSSCRDNFEMNAVIVRCQEFIDTQTVFLESEETKEFCIEQMKHLITFSNIVWGQVSTFYLHIYDNGMCQISTK
jgi:hypothetical protein